MKLEDDHKMNLFLLFRAVIGFCIMACVVTREHTCKDTHPVTNSNTTENATKARVSSHGSLYFIYNKSHEKQLTLFTHLDLVQ